MEKLNLFEGEFECCGVLCPKHDAQKHIDQMQAIINEADKYFKGKYFGATRFEVMIKELTRVSSN